MRILIVEDELTNRFILQSLLDPYGDVDIATNGAEGMKAFKAAVEAGNGYQLICLDIMMPEMDGHSVLKEIRRLEAEQGVLLGRGTKIIMTTALSDKDTVMAAFREQCDGYLVKPVTKASVQQALKKLELI